MARRASPRPVSERAAAACNITINLYHLKRKSFLKHVPCVCIVIFVTCLVSMVLFCFVISVFKVLISCDDVTLGRSYGFTYAALTTTGKS